MMALEIAMDEMAEKLGIDPIEFRILNDTQVDPEKPGAAVLAAPARRVPAHGRRALRLEQAQCRSPARLRDGRWLVGMGVAAAFRNNPADEVGRARPARQPRHRDGRDRHDRHRHRQLHDHRPDRGRDDGRAARQGGGAARRFDLPGVGRLRRAMGRQQLDRRRLCRLRQAARGGRAEARLQLRRRGVRRRRGSRGQSQRAAGAGRGRRRPRRRGRDRVRRSRQEVPAIDLRRAFRRSRRRCRDRRDPRAPHARGVRRRPHPQSQDGAQPGDRRDDHGRRARR